MSITLKPEQEQLIQAQLATGRYADVNEVIDLALQLLIEQTRDCSTAWAEATRAEDQRRISSRFEFEIAEVWAKYLTASKICHMSSSIHLVRWAVG